MFSPHWGVRGRETEDPYKENGPAESLNSNPAFLGATPPLHNAFHVFTIVLLESSPGRIVVRSYLISIRILLEFCQNLNRIGSESVPI